jgi:hypothetical protein
MPPLRQPPMQQPPMLDVDRVNALRAQIDSYIDNIVEAQKKDCVGIPAGVLRNLLTARSGDCQCRTYLRLVKEGAT